MLRGPTKGLYKLSMRVYPLCEGMLDLDFTKPVHPRFWDLFLSFIPGIFFEVSVFVASSGFRTSVGRAQIGQNFEIAIATIMAFILGNAFLLWVRFIRIALTLLYRKVWLSQRVPDLELQGVKQAWQKAAKRLLVVRYGLDPPGKEEETEWDAWRAILGTPLAPERFTPFSLAILPESTRAAAQATGWSALVAISVAPSLRVWQCYAFASFLIVFGISWEMSWVVWWNNPLKKSLIVLGSVLDDIASTPRINNNADDSMGDRS